MLSFSYQHIEGNIRVFISLDLFEGNVFRLTKETTDSFGSNEVIYNGTYLDSGNVLKLESASRYEYSKYITDIEPAELIHNQKEEILLQKEESGYKLGEYLLVK